MFTFARIALVAGILALSTPLPAFAQEGGSSGLGAAAPGFDLRTMDGKQIALSQLRDKRAAVLVFWASW